MFPLLSTGFALFAMFFGSGNLVFPVLVGQKSMGHLFPACLGIFLTGVCMPFMGLLSMQGYQGKTEAFFSLFGKKLHFWICFFSLCLMGPFGVLARCITVAHGSLENLWPELSLPFFSGLFCFFLFLSTWKKSHILQLIGTLLTPILLFTLLLIGFFGIYFSSSLPPQAPSELSYGQALHHGIHQGYQTMDLLAAFFFASFVLQQLKAPGQKTSKQTSWFAIQSSCIGMGLLSLVYFLLVYLGHLYAPLLEGEPPEKMIGLISKYALGEQGMWVLSLCVMMACFTTAVVLSTLFADFIKKHLFKEKLPFPLASCLTLGIAFCLSTLRFQGIAAFIAPILESIYPSLIVLAFVNLSHTLFNTPRYRWPCLLSLAFCIFYPWL